MIAFAFVNTAVTLLTASNTLKRQPFGIVAAAEQLIEAAPIEAIRRIACLQMLTMCAD